MPNVNVTWIDLIILIAGYAITLLSSSILVRRVVSKIAKEDYKKITKVTLDTGLIIGLCENILIISFILIGEYTALALTFTAKSIVRSKAMQERPEYYLVGTMVNFTFSILMGLLTKILWGIF
jgi:hypothetical protein